MLDAVIIGGGHNGLTCACYLAAAGLTVKILERRGIIGGAAVTEEFHPGFRNSTASYTVSLLQPKIIRDLRLAEHGLRVIERPFSNFLPLADGGYFKLGGRLEATQAEAARFSRRDAERLPAYYEMIDTVADVLRAMILRTLTIGGLHLSEITGQTVEGGVDLVATVSGEGMTDQMLEQAVQRMAAEPGLLRLRWLPVEEV